MKEPTEVVSILLGKDDHPLRGQLERMLRSNDRFAAFCDRYTARIRRKLSIRKGSSASRDQALDAMAELEAAELALRHPKLDVDYEASGGKNDAGPDLKIRCNSTRSEEIVVHVEVTRIRTGNLERRMDAVLDRLLQAVRDIPTGLSVFFEWSNMSSSPEYFDEQITALEENLEAVIDHVQTSLRTALRQGVGEQGQKIEILGPLSDLSVVITGPPCPEASDRTIHLGGTLPLFYTQNEHEKFKDKIEDKLRQLVPGESNVIDISIASSTHDLVDCQAAITHMGSLFEKKENLSAVRVRTCWRSEANCGISVTYNAAATSPIPSALKPFLEAESTSRSDAKYA